MKSIVTELEDAREKMLQAVADYEGLVITAARDLSGSIDADERQVGQTINRMLHPDTVANMGNDLVGAQWVAERFGQTV
jgi:hypothetical protein